MNIEEKLIRRKFEPRDYQKIILDAWINEGYRKILYVLPRRCLSGKSHILMANGSYKELKDLEVGEKILSWNGKTFESDIVKNKWITEEKKTVEVKSPGYLPVITTEDHLFATTWCDSEQITWKTVSACVSITKLLNYAGNPMGSTRNPDLAEFYGYMLADGYVVHYQQPKFTNINPAILSRVAELAERLFKVKCIWREKGKGFDIGFSNGHLGGGTFKNEIKELFRAEGLDVPKSQKRLPKILWEMDETSVSKYFSALISADGNIYCHKSEFTTKNGNKVPPSTEITLNFGSSYELAWDNYWLLRKMGILPQNPRIERGSNWKIRIGKGVDVNRLLSCGPIYGKEDQQRKALKQVELTVKKPKKFNSCYRTSFSAMPAIPECLYDIETEKNHNFIANGYVVHNSGKDYLAWNMAIEQCLSKPCLVLYCLPTYSQARKAVWDAISIDSTRFLDLIPPTLVKGINHSEMKITFVNGAILRLIGADSYDTSLVGTNAQMIILSEAALMNLEKVYAYARPILAANQGTVVIFGTPRGKNAFWHLFQTALNLDDWFVLKMGVDETKHIDDDVLLEERQQCSEDIFLQEWYVSFERGVEGQVFGRELDKAKLEGRVGFYPHQPQLLTHLAIDIGVNDATTIIWFQVPNEGNGPIFIIDSYSNTNMGIDHYAEKIQSKQYRMGKYFAPHDLAVREWGGGAITRYEKARQLGIDFEILEQIDLQDGIDNVKLLFPRLHIHEGKNKSLLDALENYRREYDEEKLIYTKPIHNWASHYADCLRYLCMSIHRTQRGMSAAEFDRKRAEALYGSNAGLPGIFRHDPRYDRPIN
jgi:phage terminase large subunit